MSTEKCKNCKFWNKTQNDKGICTLIGNQNYVQEVNFISNEKSEIRLETPKDFSCAFFMSKLLGRG